MALSYSFIFAFHKLNTSKNQSNENLHRIKHLFEITILYSLTFILFEATKAHSAKKNIFEKQFMVLVSR